MMRKNIKAYITLVLAALMIFSNILGVAALSKFTDVSGHWAEEYINKMVEKNIITGFEDATFRPDDNVTKLQSIIMIYRTLRAAGKVKDTDVTPLLDKYSIDLLAVPTWTDARPSVAYALEKGIITKSELATFMAGTTHNSAKRIEVTRFLGKALNLFLKENIDNTFYTFSFNDIEFLQREDYPYLDLLIKKGIIDGKGDYKGNFNPNNPINRASIAKMLSIAYDILKDIKAEEKDIVLVDDTEGVEVTIDLINKSNNIIRVVDKKGEKSTYIVNKDAQILVNGQKGSLSDLEEGTKIKIYIENNKLTKIVSDDLSTFYEGKIYAVIDMNNYYLVTLENKNNKRRTFKLDNDAYVKVDGKRTNGDELAKGQTIVDIEFDGEYIESIVVESGERVYEGILESPLKYGEYPKITIRTYGKELLELQVDEDAEVRKNNKKRTLQALTKGDIVTLYTEKNVVVKIEAISIQEDDEGIIRAIYISNEPQITIETDDEELVTYDLAFDVDIEIDGKDAEIYDLRLGYRVELEVESGTVKSIEATSVEMTNSITGIVTNIYTNNDAMVVEVINNGKREKVSVDCKDARIVDVNGDKIKLKNVDKGDEVLIYGKKDNGIFDYIAERVFIIKRN